MVIQHERERNEQLRLELVSSRAELHTAEHSAPSLLKLVASSRRSELHTQDNSPSKTLQIEQIFSKTKVASSGLCSPSATMHMRVSAAPNMDSTALSQYDLNSVVIQNCSSLTTPSTRRALPPKPSFSPLPLVLPPSTSSPLPLVPNVF